MQNVNRESFNPGATAEAIGRVVDAKYDPLVSCTAVEQAYGVGEEDLSLEDRSVFTFLRREAEAIVVLRSQSEQQRGEAREYRKSMGGVFRALVDTEDVEAASTEVLVEVVAGLALVGMGLEIGGGATEESEELLDDIKKGAEKLYSKLTAKEKRAVRECLIVAMKSDSKSFGSGRKSRGSFGALMRQVRLVYEKKDSSTLSQMSTSQGLIKEGLSLVSDKGGSLHNAVKEAGDSSTALVGELQGVGTEVDQDLISKQQNIVVQLQNLVSGLPKDSIDLELGDLKSHVESMLAVHNLSHDLRENTDMVAGQARKVLPSSVKFGPLREYKMSARARKELKKSREFSAAVDKAERVYARKCEDLIGAVTAIEAIDRFEDGTTVEKLNIANSDVLDVARVYERVYEGASALVGLETSGTEFEALSKATLEFIAAVDNVKGSLDKYDESSRSMVENQQGVGIVDELTVEVAAVAAREILGDDGVEAMSGVNILDPNQFAAWARKYLEGRGGRMVPLRVLKNTSPGSVVSSDLRSSVQQGMEGAAVVASAAGKSKLTSLVAASVVAKKIDPVHARLFALRLGIDLPRADGEISMGMRTLKEGIKQGFAQRRFAPLGGTVRKNLTQLLAYHDYRLGVAIPAFLMGTLVVAGVEAVVMTGGVQPCVDMFMNQVESVRTMAVEVASAPVDTIVKEGLEAAENLPQLKMEVEAAIQELGTIKIEVRESQELVTTAARNTVVTAKNLITGQIAGQRDLVVQSELIVRRGVDASTQLQVTIDGINAVAEQKTGLLGMGLTAVGKVLGTGLGNAAFASIAAIAIATMATSVSSVKKSSIKSLIGRVRGGNRH